MRLPKSALLAAISAGAAAAAAAAFLAPSPDARAQEVTPLLYISGMRIDGEKPVAILRLTNTSENPSDIMSFQYTIRGPDSGAPMSTPGGGPTGVALRPGRTVELDLGKIATGYRRSLGLGPYTGPVQFVATASGGLVRKFGPGTVHVDAQQTHGKAKYQASVEWR
jgi:hypothetical protein